MRSTFVALKQGSWRVVGLAVAGFAITLLQSIAYYRLVDQASVRPDTVGGYLQLHAFDPLAVLFSAWAFVSALIFVSREARQVATGTRLRDILSRIAAFAISAVVVAAAACLGAVVGVASGGQALSISGVAGAGLMLVGLCLACYGICLLVAELSPEPAIVAGGLMLTLFFLNSLSRVFTQLDYSRWLSPFRYFDLSSPLAPGGSFDVRGFATLIAVAAACLALSAFVFVRLGATRSLWNPRRSQAKSFEPSRARLLGVPVLRDLYLQRTAVVAASVGAVVLGMVQAIAAHTSIQVLLALPRLLPGIQVLIAASYSQLLARMWFDAVLLLFAALAVASVARWSAEDADGRLATVLSAPYSRAALVIERVASLTAAAVVLAALGGLAVLLTSRAQLMQLDLAHLFEACLVLVLVTAIVGGAGSLFVAWLPRAATTLVVGFVLGSYLVNQIGATLGLPAWLESLSVFHAAGDPLPAGIDPANVALMAALALAGVGSSILLMQGRDVGAAAGPSSAAYGR